jgi:translation initiation factor 3 subunit C
VLVGRAKWLKKVETGSKKKRDDDDDMDQDAVEKRRIQQEARDALNRKKKEQEMIDKLNAANLRAKAEFLDSNMTEDVLERKVNEIVMSRGKKGTDSKLVISQLEVLSKISRVFGPHREIPVLMHLISAMFDTNRLIDDYLELLNWRSCYRHLARIVRILHDEEKLVLSVLPNEDVIDLAGGQVPDTQKKAEEEKSRLKAKSGNLLKVTGSLESFITMLEADYTRALQQINPHTQVRYTPFMK